MQNTNSLLSLIEQIILIKDKSREELEKLDILKLDNERLSSENESLMSQCEKLKKDVTHYKEEAESLKKVSIIKNMSKQVHDLKNENEILIRKIKHYKSLADIKTDSSLLSASNFDGKDINDGESIEIETEDTTDQYGIKESMARLFNIPIETKMTSKEAVAKVLEYIDTNKLYDPKSRVLKYDYKLHQFLNIKEDLSVDECAELFKNLCKLVKLNGLETGDGVDNLADEKSSIKKTIEDYISNDDNKSVKSSIVNSEEPDESEFKCSVCGLIQSNNWCFKCDTENTCQSCIGNGGDDNTEGHEEWICQTCFDKQSETIKDDVEAVDEDVEEEELEVTKIGKRYYYVSIGTNIVYKAVKLKKGEYDVGKRMGTYDGKSIIKD